MMELLTFTGVDTKTSHGEALDLARRFPKIEYGILIGSNSPPTEPEGDYRHIFPPLTTVEQWCALREDNPHLKLALHFCGDVVRKVAGIPLTGPDHLDIEWIRKTAVRADRVQLNVPRRSMDKTIADWTLTDELEEFVSYMDDHGKKVILQHRGENWRSVPIEWTAIEYLYDHSAGTGLEYFDAWPEPPDGSERWGYSGGIGPDTCEAVQSFMRTYSDARLWFDMESKIRTDDGGRTAAGGWFDLEKVWAVAEVLCAPD